MKNENRTEYVARDRILSLLTDAELARVCTAETATRLAKGEYLDLEHLDRGVRKAPADTTPTSRVLPSTAVHPETWTKILAILAADGVGEEAPDDPDVAADEAAGALVGSADHIGMRRGDHLRESTSGSTTKGKHARP